MTWRLVARKDYYDAVRNRQLYGVVAVFALVGLGLGYLLGTSGDVQSAPVALLGPVAVFPAYLGVLFSLVVSHGSIVTKRLQGELTVLLGLPISRRSVVVGTAAGRGALMITCVVATLAVTFVMAAVAGTALPVVPVVVLAVALGALAVAFASMTVAVSAAATSTTGSAGGAFLLFLVFGLGIWDRIPLGIRYVLNGFSTPRTSPEWTVAFGHVDPLTAYGNVVAGLFPATRPFARLLGASSTRGPAGLPVYERPWFGALVLALWTVVPLAVGYWRLSRADL